MKGKRRRREEWKAKETVLVLPNGMDKPREEKRREEREEVER